MVIQKVFANGFATSICMQMLVANRLAKLTKRAFAKVANEHGLFAFWEDFPSTFEEGHLLLLFRFIFQRRNYALKGKKSYGSVEFKDTPL